MPAEKTREVESKLSRLKKLPADEQAFADPAIMHDVKDGGCLSRRLMLYSEGKGHA
jgi:hypothetical protein